MKDIVIRGSEGYAQEVAFLIERINAVRPTWNLLGYIDVKDVGKIKYHYPVLGTDAWFEGHAGVCCAIGIGYPKTRYKVVRELQKYRLNYPNLIDPTAIMASDHVMGIGNILTGPTRLSVTTHVGDFCLFNGVCSFGHNVTVGNFVSAMTLSVVAGYGRLGDQVLVGVGAKIMQNIKIGKGSVVGAGSVVLRNVKEYTSVFGVPAKKIMDIEEEKQDGESIYQGV